MQATEQATSAEAFVERVFAAGLAAFDIFGLYIGDKLGLYRALADGGPATAEDLAARATIDARYAREWLEQQAVSGVLTHNGMGTFELPRPIATVLLDRDDPTYLGAMARMVTGAGLQLPKVLEAYRTGDGHPWEAYGRDMIEGQADFNRPFFLNSLVADCLATVPEIHERLSRPGARVAEIGCGGGWASIAIARGYPGATVEGFDLDSLSIDLANENAREYGVANQVRFHAVDAGTVAGDRTFDLVAAFECIHDLADPVSVLRSMRSLAAEGGTVLVMDERVGDEFGEAGDVERFFYGFSITTCLPNGRAETPSAATGTVMRAPTLERYAREAGFGGIEVLPIENDFFRFYRLR